MQISPAAAAAGRPAPLRLPARPVVHRDGSLPAEERELRRRRDALKRDVVDAITATLAGSAGPDLIAERDRIWLRRLTGRMEICRTMRAFPEQRCGRSLCIPNPCHARICPDCESARAGRVRERFGAMLEEIPESEISFAVLTALNAPFGQLRDRIRQQIRHQRRLFALPLFAGGRGCTWRERDGSPGHPCRHRGCAPTSCADRCERHRARGWCPVGCRGGDRRSSCSSSRRGRACVPCSHPEHRANCRTFNHRKVAGGAWALEMPPSDDRASWNLHTNLVMQAPFISQAELSRTWARVTCPTHRGRCPISCSGGAQILWIKRIRRGEIGEVLKYATKPSALIEDDRAELLIEFLIATRGLHLVSGWGSFYRRAFERDDRDPAETVMAWADDFTKIPMPRICPFCDLEAEWGLPVLIDRTAAELVRGVHAWTGPP